MELITNKYHTPINHLSSLKCCLPNTKNCEVYYGVVFIKPDFKCIGLYINIGGNETYHWFIKIDPSCLKLGM